MASMKLPACSDSMVQMLLKGSRAKPKSPSSSISLAGQTVIITGSNTGIGLAAARAFLGLGLSHLIMGVRSVEKGTAAATSLRRDFPTIQIDVWPLDMLSYKSIQAFVRQCESLPRLDIAILNAGITKDGSVINTSTGHEEMFQVNYLSTALLAILLLPILKRHGPSPGRLTIVGSGLGVKSAFTNRNAVPLIPSFDDPSNPGWVGMAASGERYMVTKTLILMLIVNLSAIVKAEDVIINAVDPGFTSGTSLNRDSATTQKVILKVMHKFFARIAEEAALTYVDAVAMKSKESHGGFLLDWEIVGLHEMMYTTEGRKTTERLWEETLMELDQYGARDALSKMR